MNDPIKPDVISPEAAEFLRTKSPQQRLAMVFSAYDLARKMLAAQVSRLHPDWGPNTSGVRWPGGWHVDQHDVLRFAVSVMERLGVPYMVVGSMASAAYGEPRFTYDIDIVAVLTPAVIDDFCAAFPDDDYYLSREAIRDAVRTGGSFNVLHTSSGSKLDVMSPRRDDWGREQLRRRRPLTLSEGITAQTAAPEDVVIAKLWYFKEGGSTKHLRDIAGMLRVQGDGIDREDIARWAARLNLDEEWRQAASLAAGT